MSHPSQLLDDLVHQRVRLGILAVLSEADRADFGHLRNLLELTDGNLSRHLAVLSEVGFVNLQKKGSGRTQRTIVHSTSAGREALATHLATLQQIIDTLRGPT